MSDVRTAISALWPARLTSVDISIKVEIVAPWVRGSWELSAVPDALALDGSLAAALDMPGLVLSGMEYGNGWTLKGEVYATPE